MKQWIDKEQLDDLGEREFLALERWKVKHSYGGLPYKSVGKWMNKTMSIGQMIEFLGDDLSSIIGVDENNEDGNGITRWLVASKEPEVEKELDDALWEAVKKKLKP